MIVDNYGFKAGDRVRVVSGSLVGCVGTLLSSTYKSCETTVRARLDDGRVFTLAPRQIRKFGLLDHLVDDPPC